MRPNIAVVGATGNVGREILNILNSRKFPADNVHAIASLDSVGSSISFGEKILEIEGLENFDFYNMHIVFVSAGSIVSKNFVQKIVDKGAIVIDKSSYFRMEKNIPLIVPEINAKLIHHDTQDFNGIVCSPNCCAIPLAMVLHNIKKISPIERIVVSTYQSVSGEGKKGMDELYFNTKRTLLSESTKQKVFEKEIAFNLIPKIGNFESDLSTSEEVKIEQEVKKIVQLDENLPFSVTCVRVPAFIGHFINLHITLEQNISAKKVHQVLSDAPGIQVSAVEEYYTPLESKGKDKIFVSRIRNDKNHNNTINLCIAIDNLRKGAALNAVQIAETVLKEFLAF